MSLPVSLPRIHLRNAGSGISGLANRVYSSISSGFLSEQRTNLLAHPSLSFRFAHHSDHFQSARNSRRSQEQYEIVIHNGARLLLINNVVLLDCTEI